MMADKPFLPTSALAAELFSKAQGHFIYSDFMCPARGNASNTFSGWSTAKTALDATSSIAPLRGTAVV